MTSPTVQTVPPDARPEEDAAASSHVVVPEQGSLRWPRLFWMLLREMGPGWALYRLRHAIAMKSGLVKWRNRAISWAEERRRWPAMRDDKNRQVETARTHRFFFDDLNNEFSSIVASFGDSTFEADEVLSGRWRYFGTQRLRVGFPPDWHRNPLTDQRAPADRHWSEIGADIGDVKLIWEASRFSPVYALARAYVATADEKYAEGFWRLVDDWRNANPPHRGINWGCGQECALRMMAWYFGAHAFAQSPTSTPERLETLGLLTATHAERIERNIGYALSQNNNHGVVEAMGLWTAGVLSPHLQQSSRWKKRGRALLERLARQQIYRDGAYIQHSVNYHRLMLQAYVWSMRLGEVNGERFSEELYAIVGRAVDFLAALTDPTSGRAPNYGNNDGAWILQLDSCDYPDLRPVLQAAHYLVRKRHLCVPGPWDEDLLWLFGRESLRRDADVSTIDPPGACMDSGYYVFRGQESRGMIRCGAYRHRPGHADQLHLDLWWRGLNVACDAGTFAYNGVPPWRNGLAATTVHNTVCLDGREQMRRSGTFMWLDWAQGKTEVLKQGASDDVDYWEGWHDGYRREGVVHRRAVTRLGDCWVVIDDVIGSGAHSVRLQWLTPSVPYEMGVGASELILHTSQGRYRLKTWCSRPADASLVRAGQLLLGRSDPVAAQVRGWSSPSYMAKEPALSFAREARAELPLRFITVLHGEDEDVEIHNAKLQLVTASRNLEIELFPPGVSPIVRANSMPISTPRVPAESAEEPLSFHAKETARVVLIHQAFITPDAAGGTRHYEFAHRLVSRGHHFTIVASDLSYLTGEQLGARGFITREECNGVEVLRAFTCKTLHRSFLWRIVSFLSFACTSIIAALRAGRADLIMGTTPPIFQAASACFVAFCRRRPFLLEVRDLWPDFAIDMGVLKHAVPIALSRWLEKMLYHRATHIVVNSPAYREHLIGRGVAADKITVIANGVDPEMFAPEDDGHEVRLEFGLQNKFIVTYAGALGLANDIGTVLRAAARLKGQEKVHFLIVGDGKERRNLEEAARAMALTNVTFVGAQPKKRMPDFLAASDACIAILQGIPMFRSTYPNKVFDYMAAGRPTLLAIDGVIREVIESAGGGVFVAPGDDEALAVAIERLSRDPALCEQMGKRARRYVCEHFNRDTQARSFEELVTRLVQQQ